MYFGFAQHRGAPGLWLGLILGLSAAAIGLGLRVRSRLRPKAG
jgi:Na+-driven multidrug efflux pump